MKKQNRQKTFNTFYSAIPKISLNPQQFPEAVGTLSSPCLFISRYVKLKPHPARLSSFPIGGFYGNRGT